MKRKEKEMRHQRQQKGNPCLVIALACGLPETFPNFFFFFSPPCYGDEAVPSLLDLSSATMRIHTPSSVLLMVASVSTQWILRSSVSQGLVQPTLNGLRSPRVKIYACSLSSAKSRKVLRNIKYGDTYASEIMRNASTGDWISFSLFFLVCPEC